MLSYRAKMTVLSAAVRLAKGVLGSCEGMVMAMVVVL